ncbi:MAG: flagellar basal body-associated FliL family protein [Opitutae bacterium]
MAAKPEAPLAAPTAAGVPPPAPVVAMSFKSAMAPWLPVIAALVLAPILSWTVAEFVLLPRLQKKLTAIKAGGVVDVQAPGETETKADGPKESKGGKEGKGGKEAANPASYEFQNIVVNLSGTMGTRYLKTSFIVTGVEANIKPLFESQKAKLTDITLNVLSSLSLADLEEPGAKNVLREKLVLAYNQALGKRVAEQVYFSDFVVQ